MAGLVLGCIGAGVGLGAWLHYLWLIPRERVPEEPNGHYAAFLVGLAVAGLGVVLSPGVLTSVAAATAAMCLGSFAFLMSQAPLPDGDLIVSVGDPLPAFEAFDSSGKGRSIEDWRGEKLLLKFFRGKW